jgi:hypothetical protein
MAKSVKKAAKKTKPSGEARIVAQFVEPPDFVPDERLAEHAPAERSCSDATGSTGSRSPNWWPR